MDFIFSDLKEEELWEDLQLPSIKMRKEQCSLEHQIKDSCLYVIGQLDQLMKLEVKMILLYHSGTSREASVQ